jgi:hypothetical protein
MFSFKEVGDYVEMKSAGVLDTSKLVSVSPGFWGDSGVETNAPPESDIMGDTTMDVQLDQGYAFNPGTDLSPWIGDMFSNSNFGWTSTGTTQFATYYLQSNLRTPGISLSSADMIGSLWTPDISWRKLGSLSVLGLTPGTYSIADAVTSESITIEIQDPAAVPGPMPILGAAAAFHVSRKLRLALRSRA